MVEIILILASGPEQFHEILQGKRLDETLMEARISPSILLVLILSLSPHATSGILRVDNTTFLVSLPRSKP